MRSFRDIQAIVQDYPPAPDEETLRRLCERHLEHVNNVMDITDWIKHDTPNPYLRELYATQTALLLKEHCEEDNWQAAACEEAIDALALIARQAFGSQIGDNLYHVEKIAYTQPQQEAVVQSVPYFKKLEEQIAYVNERMDKLEQKLTSSDNEPHWPYYTPKATEKDKQFFENQLRKWCTSKKRRITQNIKTYLDMKVTEGIIYRPPHINDEWEALVEFGYPYLQSAYY